MELVDGVVKELEAVLKSLLLEGVEIREPFSDAGAVGCGETNCFDRVV